MDIDRLVQLVEAEVRRLLATQATGPPPHTASPSPAGGKAVLVIGIHNTPPEALLGRLRREGKDPVVWKRDSTVEDFEEIWIVNLKWSDVAKMALGIFDTPPLEAILHILSTGKEIIAEPLQIPTQCPPSLADLLKSYWARLLSLGIREPRASQPFSCPPPSAPSRTIITQEEVREAKEKGLQVMILPPRAIVTDMARDLAERLGIQIREEEQS